MKIKEVMVSAKKKINIETCVYRESPNKINVSPTNIDYIQINLSNNRYFEIQIDSDGDLCLRGSGDVFVRSNDENELIFQIKKSS